MHVANVVVGVTGGIAAYKSAAVIRLFAEAGHSVQVVATQNAFKFIGKTTLEALSGKPVSIVDPDLFTDVDQVKHIAISKSAELVVVAPATASFIARLAAGIADDLLTTTVLAATCPVIVAPAMHTEMWENQATQSNISTLRSRGINIVRPEIGRLTGEDSGVGRLAEPQVIFESAIASLGGALSGKKVLVTAGGTREPIDAARFIGNFSSGKQGLAFARAAKQLGAEVRLIAANIDEAMTAGLDCVNIQTAMQLGETLTKQHGNFDILVMAAAVADFRPAASTDAKLKRSEVGEKLDLELVANPDLLAQTIGSLKHEGSKAIVIGFAAEASDELEELGRKKLASKGCDYIVANNISNGKVFGKDETEVVLVSKDSTMKIAGTKQTVAAAVLSQIASNMGES
ncbi:MAG: bifunctional phosphopantothenoylcysteine decarboxylase/phosphopantothenate--cysteine ligase CoaBC [Actinobacteria bacterium]|nr:bifunctional phosphopantothenoylcysteine decarboxylase/phosphopantothenate--cysteine ligase CoaBC [Actinomycetota bacterium]